MTEMSLPNYSEFGLAPKSSKVPFQKSSFSLSFNEDPPAMGPNHQNKSRPNANKSKKASNILKVEKISKNEKKEKGNPKKKSQKTDIPDMLRSSITPAESIISSSNADELVEANFLSTNVVTSATERHTIGSLVVALSLFAGGAVVA